MKNGYLTGVAMLLLLSSLAGGDEPAPSIPNARADPADADPAKTVAELQDALERTAQAVKSLKEEHAREQERQRKQADLQQQQIEVLEKTARVLAEQIKRQSTGEAAGGAVATQTATLEARSRQAAQRDRELAGKVDELTERVDFLQRNGAPLPYTVKELFLPTQTNETPLAIYGQLLGGYSRQNGQAGLFQSPEFGPWILLQLNKKFLLSVNFDIGTSSIALGQAQLDWYMADWLTLSAGRFLTPIGSFNERLSPEWINKLPDIPIMFRQVLPLTSTDGLQLRGSRYLGGLPLKLEYSLYAGNGFQLPSQATGVGPIADLQGLTGGPDEVNARAFGGRLGMWVPQYGLNFGFSGYQNGLYSPGTRSKYEIWDFDANYHWGNWDFRTEYAANSQEARAIIGNNINREGFYAQIAYRDYNCSNWFLRNVETVFRYGFADFQGIAPGKLNPANFPTTFDVPVSRNQYTLGINYYFYPSMVLKFAYEINTESAFHFQDNIFLAQGVWAF